MPGHLAAPRFLPLVFVTVWLGACAAPTPPAKLALAQAGFADLAGWADDDVGAAVPALLKSCNRIEKLAPDAALDPEGVMGRAGDWGAPCAAAVRLPANDSASARRFFESEFRVWRALDAAGSSGFATGYYEAELKGARQPDARYRFPIYRPPADLVAVDLGAFRPDWRGQTLAGRLEKNRLVPHYDRATIETGALAGKGLEILWVDDAQDAFFLHVQGSGRVTMKEGNTVRLGFAARNGHAYTAIGRVLVERGVMPLEDVTLQAIRAWIAANPAEGTALMRRNRSYIFFREIEGEGPLGAEGVALTPERSLAVDPAFVPFGLPLYLATRDPLDPARPFRRLALAQDQGSAIKGPLRIDVFFGAGPKAEARAGALKHPAELFVLRPKSLPAP
jgi:membrane-bound lytic murein transglycosylase A